jgi:outer membrane receptor protein involved in Fe transport
MRFNRKGFGVRALLATGVSALTMTALTTAAFAQPEEVAPAAASDEESQDTVVVTGSRIGRSVSDEAIAVTEIGSLEFDYRGFTNTIEGLEQLPFVGPGVNNQGNSTQFGDNNAFVDLLNFGTQRTLTLVDGRRFVSSNQGTVFVPGNVTGAQVDLTIINPSLIKRTEVQTVGSGPIYGADAVAGVVNVILDREFDGFEALGQGGITQRGDGGEYRFSAAWGKDIFGGRGHLVLAGEYFNSDGIIGGIPAGRRSFNDNIGLINNPFSFGATDGVPNTVFQANQLNPQLPTAGLIANRQTNVGSFATFLFPTRAAGDIFPGATDNAQNDAAFNTFVAQTGLTPFEFALANPTLNGINPLLFAGTFGLTSGFLTVPNTDAATVALGLTRLAVPTSFDANGNPVTFNLGNITPPNIADQDDVVGGDGFGGAEFANFRADVERIGFNTLWNYDLSETLRYEGDFLFSQITNTNVSDGQGTQTPACALTAGNCGVPIFFNQNPFVTPATLAFLNGVSAANASSAAAFNFSTIGGQPFFALTRSLDDITGGFDNTEGNRSRTFRTSHALFGEFETLGRSFQWDVAFAYSRNTSRNSASTDIRDIEFALATDVVLGANGQPVCRQQTLAAPEAVNVRNPLLTNININTPGGLVPTQAQIDACVPLNLFGVGAASPEAIAYVTANGDSVNQAEQYFGSASLTGVLVELPAGPLQFNSNFEWRREALTFTPNDVFEFGLGRQTIGQPSDGAVRFFEGGQEFRAPIFGGDVRPFFFNELELSGAVRVVQRSGSGTPNGVANPRVAVDSSLAHTFTAGGRWSPVEGLTIRGNKTRAVRSPSITESLGAPQTGFSALGNAFPCNGLNRNNGPAGGIRIANCDAFEASLGLAPGTFAALIPPNAAVAAGVGGNPAIQNEISNNWTAGIVWQPEFLKGFSIQADWVDLQLDNQIVLAFLGTQCFDQPEFPNTIIGGVPVCDAINLAIENPSVPGQFIQPQTNLITGNPLAPPAIPGSLAPVQAPFTIASAQFSNVNQGSLRLSGLNTVVNYSFDAAEAFNALTGAFIKNGPSDLGTLSLTGTVFYLDRFESSSSGTFIGDINTADGEPGNSRFQTRLDVAHRIGKFAHVIQWFRDSATVLNADSTAPLDQAPDFFVPEFNTFNYNISYQLNENFTLRGIVNNLTDARNQPQFGSANFDDQIGRNFILRVDARF